MTVRLASPSFEASKTRAREPNPIDFWRGFALINIFLSHMPGNAFERLTLRHYSISDSAELFVFLAGSALRLSSDKAKQSGIRAFLWGPAQRVLNLFQAQIVLAACALSIMAIANWLYADPTIMRFSGIAPVSQMDRVKAWFGALLGSYQLQYFDILPLYVLLTVASPAILLLHRLSSWLLLAVSLAIWMAAAMARLNLPTWPGADGWFFDPLSWQLVFAFGFVLAGEDKPTCIALDLAPKLFWLSAAIVAISAVAIFMRIMPDGCAQKSGWAINLLSKTFEGPVRFFHFVAVLIVCRHLFALVSRRASLFGRLLSLIGRHSLPIFVAGSLLSLIGRILVHIGYRGILASLTMTMTGLMVIVLIACCTERHRLLRPRVASWQQGLRSA